MGHGSSSGGKVHSHITPFAGYLKVFLILLVLTAITVLAAQFDFGVLNTIIAMLIATVKATLVLAFFMHLKYDGKLFPAIFATSVFFLLVFYLITEIDMVTRVAQSAIME